MIVRALYVIALLSSVYACMHVSLRVILKAYVHVCVCVRAWVSVFEECAYVEMRDSIIIATQSEQRSSGHSKHRNNERTIHHLLHCA